MFVTDVNRRDDSAFNLLELGYFFAVKKVEPEIGTISLQAWTTLNDQQTYSINIPLINCS